MGARLKFLPYNYIDENILANFSYSSQNPSYPASNLQDPFRSKIWRSSGNFEVSFDENELVFNDGTDKVATLTIGVYISGALMATELQTKLNAVSSGFTVTYSNTTNKFTISKATTFVLKWSQSTGVANLFGFNNLIDDTGRNNYESDSRRINWPAEWLKFDLGIARNPKGVVIIDNLEENIKIQPTVSIKLQGAFADSWNSPEEITLDWDPSNISKINMNGLFSKPYRYIRLYLADVDNPLGFVQLGKLYIGDVYELESSDVQREFQEETVDLSELQRSINGELYSDNKPSFSTFSSVLIEFCNKNDIDTIADVYANHRTYKPFFVSIDSEAKATNNINEWTKYVRFSEPPSKQTVTCSIWNCQFGLEELL